VAEGIERLEFDYGIDSAVGAAPLDGSADTYSRCAPCTAAEWARVVSVRISLLARNTEATAGYTDTKTYAMGIIGDVSPLTGFTNYKRHAFQAVVRVNNQSMRGEK
jgi:type IV pilus assembly protein PilW